MGRLLGTARTSDHIVDPTQTELETFEDRILLSADFAPVTAQLDTPHEREASTPRTSARRGPLRWTSSGRSCSTWSRPRTRRA
ncbi:LEPR-XLL domain-containing protein [Palleronia salina]|uniref:LEPR-XLL domain-containing protein n=1 Tax=Palleronia salina TaxID=313368 RepID=UPI000932CD45